MMKMRRIGMKLTRILGLPPLPWGLLLNAKNRFIVPPYRSG
jgi:hypothetical protein